MQREGGLEGHHLEGLLLLLGRCFVPKERLAAVRGQVLYRKLETDDTDISSESYQRPPSIVDEKWSRTATSSGSLKPFTRSRIEMPWA